MGPRPARTAKAHGVAAMRSCGLVAALVVLLVVLDAQRCHALPLEEPVQAEAQYPGGEDRARRHAPSSADAASHRRGLDVTQLAEERRRVERRRLESGEGVLPLLIPFESEEMTRLRKLAGIADEMYVDELDGQLRHLHDLSISQQLTLRQNALDLQFDVVGRSDSGAFTSNMSVSVFDISLVDPVRAPATIMAAMQIVANAWTSNTRVNVSINFDRLGAGSQSSRLLGLGAPAQNLAIDYNANGIEARVLYPVASYEAALGNGTDVNLGSFDCIVELNADINWYYGSDPGGVGGGGGVTQQFDLQTVIIHEMMHALFMVTNFFVEIDAGVARGGVEGGQPTAYDLYAGVFKSDNTTACSVLGFLNGTWNTPTEELAEVLTSNLLLFSRQSDFSDSSNALHSPSTFISGSSVSHVDSVRENYPVCDRIMAPSISPNTANRCVGRLLMQFMFSIRTLGAAQAPLCELGDFSGGGNVNPEDSTIAGLQPAVFYGIIGGVGGLVLLCVICLIITCVMRANKRKRKPSYGYVSPSGYMSPYQGQMYGDPYGSAYASPRGQGPTSGRLYMSPGAMTPGGGKGNRASGMMYPPGYVSQGATPRSGRIGGPPPGVVYSNPSSPRVVRPPQGPGQLRSNPASPRGPGSPQARAVVASPRAAGSGRIISPGAPPGQSSMQGGVRTPGGARTPGGGTRTPTGVPTPRAGPPAGPARTSGRVVSPGGSGRIVGPGAPPSAQGRSQPTTPRAVGVVSPPRGVTSPPRGVTSPQRGVTSPQRGVTSPQRTSGRVGAPAAPGAGRAAPPPPVRVGAPPPPKR